MWAYTRKVPKATLKRRVTVHIHIKGRGRTPDPDAYFKSLLDALVFNEMLVDDGSKWVELAPVLFFRGNEKKTVIILEDMA